MNYSTEMEKTKISQFVEVAQRHLKHFFFLGATGKGGGLVEDFVEAA